MSNFQGRPEPARRWVPSARPGAKLAVFLGDERLGTIERRGPSRYRFGYSSQALADADRGPTLSVSLPPQAKAFTPSRSAPFFDGLLPEGPVRTAIARALRVSEEDGFGLLGELGADCAGAVVVLPEGREPGSSESEGVRPLDTAELEALVESLPRHPLGVSTEPEGVRLSLGGVQQKLVLTRSPAGEFGQPLGGAPSTCLLKPDYGLYEGLAANEAFCMRVAAAAGLDVATAEVIQVGPTPCLYVERFDRAIDDEGRVVRTHQEDMCQALGILPAAKYEENEGPSVAGIVGLLRSPASARAAADINAFVKSVLVSFLLGNSDAHGKNFALLHEAGGGTRLAPLYDIVSSAVYPELTTRMAMRIGGVDDPAEVDLAAWRRLASESGLGGQLPGLVRNWSADVLARAEEVRELAVAEGWHHPAIDRIVDLCRGRVAALAAS